MNVKILILGFFCIFLIQELISKDSVFKQHLEYFEEVKFNEYGITYILYKSKWVAVNKRQKILYEVFNYDNSPDEFREGLHRFLENGKMGFANQKGQKVIPAQFDFVFPFENGKAKFCNECVPEKKGDMNFYNPKKGKWGEVDKQGKIKYISNLK
jgi:hypothetical protein